MVVEITARVTYEDPETHEVHVAVKIGDSLTDTIYSISMMEVARQGLTLKTVIDTLLKTIGQQLLERVAKPVLAAPDEYSPFPNGI